MTDTLVGPALAPPVVTIPEPPQLRREITQATLAMARSEFDAAAAALGGVIERDPQSVTAHLLRARCAFALGDLVGAGEDLRRSLEIEPGHRLAGVLLRTLSQ